MYRFQHSKQKKITFFSILILCFAYGLALDQQPDGVTIIKSDFRALEALKHELVDFRGGLSSWNDTGHGACSGGWAGIRCSKGHVIAIQLPYKNLGGRISEKIGELKALQRLSLHHNGLTGPVPYSIGFLPNLRGIYLFNNRLVGSIPPSIANIRMLQNLDLSNNQLTGTIPPNLFNSTNNLFRLNLSFNSISGPVPQTLTQSFSLAILDLRYNNLSGSIPDSWAESLNGNNKYELRILSLDRNNISGRIPSSLSRLNSLEELTLSNNHINGPIPEELGSLLQLKTLDLSKNSINGSFPTSFSNITSLVSLNLEHNLLDSQILGSIDRLQNLSILNLGNNHFNGEFPETIGNISSLTRLDLSNNNFSGKIPASLTKLANLTAFDVSNNNLSGNVPSTLLEKFNSSAFVGNKQLCGYSPTAIPCPATTPQNPSSNSTESSKNRIVTAKELILIPAGAILVILIIMCSVLLCCLIRKRAATKSKNTQKAIVAEKTSPVHGAEVTETGGKLVHFDGPFVFTADDLLCATAEIMGKSTYGTVYKASLEDNNQVAVKRLREKVTKSHKEFETEVVLLGKIRNENILALRAYYLGPKGEKLLVFDYMPNGSLASFLHARGPETSVTWQTRLKIAIGITRGLCYLHSKEINMVHGNLTSSNIVLDEQNDPKIGDVGLSRLMTGTANTNMVATAGSLGYRAPELSKLKNATTKTDIYSLGVIILELLTGKSPSEATDGADLPQWVASIVKEEWTNEVFDVELMKDNNNNNNESNNTGNELLNTLKLALHCVDPSPSARPEAHQVLQQLEEISKPEEETVAGSADDGAKVTTNSE